MGEVRGRDIRIIRIRAKVSQADVAKRLSLNPNRMSDIEQEFVLSLIPTMDEIVEAIHQIEEERKAGQE